MKFKPGPLAGELSGSTGTLVASHNRYGVYFRERVIPVNPDSPKQQAVRGNFAAASSAWPQLTDAERMTWKTWASNNTIIDRLGSKQNLSPNAAFVSINARMLLSGTAMLRVAPVLPHPASLTVLTLIADLKPTNFKAAFLPTPLGTGLCLMYSAAIVTSPSHTYVRNQFKHCGFSAQALASPLMPITAIEAVFGTLQNGQIVTIQASVFDTATGLLSMPLRATDTVFTTP